MGTCLTLVCPFLAQNPFLARVSWCPPGMDSATSSGTPTRVVTAGYILLCQQTALSPRGQRGKCSLPSPPQMVPGASAVKVGGPLSPPASARPLPASPGLRRRGHFENTHHLFDVGLQSQKAAMATANVSICFFSIDPCAVCRWKGRKPANRVKSTS